MEAAGARGTGGGSDAGARAHYFMAGERSLNPCGWNLPPKG